jgi:HlyD family secretion protein
MLSRFVFASAAIATLGAAAIGSPSDVWPRLMAEWNLGRTMDGPNASYRTAKLEQRRIVNVVTATGQVNPVAFVLVSSQVSGQIREIYADFSAEVKRGEPIALIDPTSFEIAVDRAAAEVEIARATYVMQQPAIDRAVADVESARSDLAVARANLVAARIQVDQTAREAERKRTLAAIASVVERERATSAHETAEAQLRAAEAQEKGKVSLVGSLEAQVRTARSQLATLQAVILEKEAALRSAKTELARTVIRAPVDGVIIHRDVEAGQTLAATLQAPVLFRIAQDLRDMQVNISVAEGEIGSVRVGQRVEFAVDSYPGRTFEGKVIQIRQQPQVVQNVVTYTVVASAANPELLLMPGMTATAKIVVDEQPNALAVPVAALRFRPADVPKGGPSRIFIEKNGELVAMPVKPGISDGVYTQIEGKDLSPGDRVIIGFSGGSARATQSDRRLLIGGF